jgi:hypothetical protein
VVVGAVDVAGRREDYSQGVDVELDSSAVGSVICPSNQGEGLQQMEGTSFGITWLLCPFNKLRLWTYTV